MPQQVAASVENNFIKGLVTEATGLNFPENAATDTDNCEYTLIGEVARRLGMDFEENYSEATIDFTDRAVNTFEWNNAGGDGGVQILASQVGENIHFYSITSSTIANPLSDQKLLSIIDISPFADGTFDATLACEFTSGNGYLFVFHPSCDPLYCTYVSGTVTAAAISVQVRDWIGINDSLNTDSRPQTLTSAHTYNLQNQGWAGTPAWSAQSNTQPVVFPFVPIYGAFTFTVATGIVGISAGQIVSIVGHGSLGSTLSGGGVVLGYGGSSLQINVTSPILGPPGEIWVWDIAQSNTGKIGTWFTAMGNYPSNADQWWRFKNASQVFDPATTAANVTLGTGPAPKAHYIYSAFNFTRSATSGVSSIPDVTTTARPTNGTWFQGRIWYTGINAAQPATSLTYAHVWTENIYFSQVVDKPSDFGKCYQVNDPTSEELFDILPTDGGIIVIQGSGMIFKLFPIQNGLLVFAANGIWFITGSQGIGFSATDYTVTKLSSVKSISSTSYVDVEGLPYFWTDDGIYAVQPQQGGGLSVVSMTFTSLDSYYADIPQSSKRKARGDYDPINYVIKWIFKDTEAADVTDSYNFNKILNYNTANKAFYPYTINTEDVAIHSINYIIGPGGGDCPPPMFKHFVSYDGDATFADEHDDDYVDWASAEESDYSSYFVTGYKLRGQGIKKFQVQYIQMFQRASEDISSYNIQGVWDYGTSGNSGRWTSVQQVLTDPTDFGVIYRRHKIRGSGYALQIKIFSTSGRPFHIIGWAAIDTINAGT